MEEQRRTVVGTPSRARQVEVGSVAISRCDCSCFFEGATAQAAGRWQNVVHLSFGQGAPTRACPNDHSITMLHVQCYVNGFSRFVTRLSREGATHSELRGSRYDSKLGTVRLLTSRPIRKHASGHVRDMSRHKVP